MQCVILAGGYGTRLRPLTYTQQKVLIPVMNKPMIMHIIEALPKSVNKVIIAANYKKEQIQRYFAEHNTGKEIIINPEPQPLGTAGAVKHAEKYIDSDFMVVNSDIISSLEIDKFIDYYKYKKAFGLISLWPVENVREFGVVSIESDGKITYFVEKPSPENAPSNLINSGHYCLDYKTLDMIPKDMMVSMEKEIFPKIIKEHRRFYGYSFSGYWIDVGKISNYLLAHRMIMEKDRIINFSGQNCNVEGELDYSCIGNKVKISKGAVLENTVVFDESKISEGARITDSVIGTGCRIEKNAVLANVIVGDRHTIPENAKLSDTFVWEKAVPKGYPEKQVGNVIEPDKTINKG